MKRTSKWNIKQLLYPFFLIVGHQSRIFLYYYENTLGNYESLLLFFILSDFASTLPSKKCCVFNLSENSYNYKSFHQSN